MSVHRIATLICFYCSTVILADVLVTLPIGQLNGRIEYSQRNVTFYAFQSIPYGKPPVGDLRFRDPQPADRWEGVYDATRLDGNICYQVGTTIQENQSEDCLYLNVYTPKYPNASANLPVMVHFHGGAFLMGTSNFYAAGPHYLIESGIVVVTILYRLGPFGFLATGDTVVSGNMGLKDQNLGLQWIRDNIQYFGGDPAKVTINGQSAGSASVTYHALSPKSAGLFRAVIGESGTALNTWAYNRNHVLQAYTIANICGADFQPDTTTEQLVQYLRTIPAETLTSAANNFSWTAANEDVLHGFSFTPVIEPEHDGAFLTKNMYEVIASGNAHKVSYILGVNSEEMLKVKASNLTTLNLNAESLDGNVSYAVPNNMHLYAPDRLTAAGEALRQIYTTETFQSNLSNLVRFYSDAAFTHSIIHHGFLQSAFSDVYFYVFSYHGEIGGNKVSIEGAEKVSHSEELAYIWVWGNNSNLNDYPPSDILTSDRIRGLFTNFVKTLNPTPTQDPLFNNLIWPKVSSDNYQYLSIDENLSIEVNPKENTYTRWVNSYEEYAVKPYDTF